MSTNNSFKRCFSVVCLILTVVFCFVFSGCDVILDAVGMGKTMTIVASYDGEGVEQGDELDKSDITVTVTHVDGLSGYTNSYRVSSFQVSGFSSANLGEQTATISYTEGGKTATTTIKIPVIEKVVAVSITAVYLGHNLQVGGTVDKSDFAVTVSYSDKTQRPASAESILLGEVDTDSAGDKFVEITYVEGAVGQPLTTTVKITVAEPPVVLDRVSASYVGALIYQNDVVVKTQFLITEWYSDGTKCIIEDFVVGDVDTSIVGNQQVVITYQKDGQPHNVTTTVTVLQKQDLDLSSISATFDNGNFCAEETLTNADFTVIATFSNQHTLQVTDFVIIGDTSFATAGEYTVNLSYTYQTVTKTCSVVINVLPKPVTLAAISAEFVNARFEINQTLTASDFVVSATMSDGTLVQNISGFEIRSPLIYEEVGNYDIVIAYSFNGVEQTVTVNVEVKPVAVEIADYGKYGSKSDDGKSVKIINTAPVVSNDSLQIHFLELGNQYAGDCTYIKAGDTDILIDAGSRKGSAKTIAEYLTAVNFDGSFEYVIATHAHEDHIAGFMGKVSKGDEGIFERYECKTIIDFSGTNQKLLTDKGNATLYAEYLEDRDAEVANGAVRYSALECYQNDNAKTRFSQSVNQTGARRYIKLADNLEMEILYNYFYDHSTNDENDYSVCILINQYGEGYNYANPSSAENDGKSNHFLFTGDLEKEGEELLVENNEIPNVVIFKGGHHGSPTSTTEGLLAEINPKAICLCTCMGSDEYTTNLEKQFPGMAMMQRVSAYTDMLFATSLYNPSAESKSDLPYSFNGNITIVCNKQGVNLTGSNHIQFVKDSTWFANRYTEWSPTMALKENAV